ncbi:MAG: Fe-S cluster assembly sulfur transfer protein SufU [Candidatus Pacearchaeota archaeon]
MSSEMYKQQILELYREPENKGHLNNHTHENFRNNPLCGDEIKMEILTKDNKIEDIKFSGEGCAISTATASLITDKVKGLSIEETKSLTKEDILDLLGIEVSETRLKCALLPLETIKGAFENA